MFVPTSIWQLPFPSSGKPMLFVHTPKCGGRFLERAFGRRIKRCFSQRWPEMQGHLTWKEYSTRLADRGQSIADLTTFSVIRNPWQWHLSWYNYIRQDSGGRRTGMPKEHELFQNFSFLDYLHWLDDPLITDQPNQYYLLQVSDWVIDDTGKIAVDEVLRQETLLADLKKMARKHNLLLQFPKRRRNVSFRGDYRAEYTSEGVDIVARRHRRDIELFGYSFDSGQPTT